MSNSIPLRHGYMSHLPFLPAERRKAREIEGIRDLGAGVFLRTGKKFLQIWNPQVMGKKMWVLSSHIARTRVKSSLVSL